MFDPTAFDNMKVVVEGALYDLDLNGEISIVDRNDIVNVAKLSRTYETVFIKGQNRAIKCRLVLQANLENLAAELLQTSLNSKLSGANLSIVFTLNHENKQEIFNKIEDQVIKIWGHGRSVTQKAFFHPIAESSCVTNEITITFQRLILEEQIDDLVVMVDYILQTLEKLSIIQEK